MDNFAHLLPSLTSNLLVITIAVAQKGQVLEEAKSCFPCIYCRMPSIGWKMIWPNYRMDMIHPNPFEEPA